MAQDYSKLKNADLENLLKERALPSGGKKADMVARLVEADRKAPPATPSISTPAARSTAAGTPPATSASIAAGGNERVANPVAVPNQKQAVDPANTADLKVSVPESDSKGLPGDSVAHNEDAVGKTADQPPADFSSGLASTSIDDEIAKRKARAEKFGLDDKDAIRALERAKRFGTGPAATGDTMSNEMNKGIGRLDEALSERQGRKRAREEGATENSFDDPGLMKRARGRGGRFRGGSRPRGSIGRRGGGRGGMGLERKPSEAKTSGGGASWMNEKDRTAAEARKAKFGT